MIPPDPDTSTWGVSVSHCAFAEIPPGMPYPPRQLLLPGEPAFSWSKGRMLDEYQLIYISGGRGVFESKQTGRVAIQAGHVLVVFPGVWHRYRPAVAAGWEENRIGFEGKVADKTVRAFFSPAKPVITVGQSRELKDLIRSMAGLVDKAPACCHQIIAARAMEAIALVRSLSMALRPADKHTAEKIQRAREYLNQHCKENIDIKDLAAKLGLSESRLRAVFKGETGVAPHQYLLNIRMNLARHWLTDSSLTIGQIAEELGFSSVFYFSRLFKNKVGCAPSVYRKR
jgi:AraC-like DNA-binding protein